jgi:hypothetical protein
MGPLRAGALCSDRSTGDIWVRGDEQENSLFKFFFTWSITRAIRM